MATRTAQVSGQQPEFILRNFAGMNNLASRDMIEDEEFWWCENAMPLAGGNLVPGSQLVATKR